MNSGIIVDCERMAEAEMWSSAGRRREDEGDDDEGVDEGGVSVASIWSYKSGKRLANFNTNNPQSETTISFLPFPFYYADVIYNTRMLTQLE